MPDSLGFVDRDAGGNKICLREKALGGIDFHHPPNFGTAVLAHDPLPHCPMWGAMWGSPRFAALRVTDRQIEAGLRVRNIILKFRRWHDRRSSPGSP